MVPPPTGPLPGLNHPFTKRSFELLAQLHEEPTSRVYLARQEEFQVYIEQPFQRLLRKVALRLPETICRVMETEKRVFSRFVKNDFGRGGCWDFYWGAFYTRGGRRIEDAQLSVWMNYRRFEIGFYIGNYGTAVRERFQRNCQRYVNQLIELFDPILVEGSILLGAHDNFDVDPDGAVVAKRIITWQEMFEYPAQADYDASLIVPVDQALTMTEDELVELITQTFEKLFPLVLLATLEDPLPALVEYFGRDNVEIVEDTNPEYPLVEMSQDTGVSQEILGEWVEAIERRKQAVMFGPSGVGKTYLARLLARHLVAGSDGFVELVQFHPSYSYSDFILGYPTRTAGNIQGEDHAVKGRFLEFCEQARGRHGCCVMIIDEIGRADLARVFGELIYLLEYRDQEISLANGERFGIPANVRILGAMNTPGPDAFVMDLALRRRFVFLPVFPDYDLLRNYVQKQGFDFPVEALVSVLQHINERIGNHNYALGTSFFLRPDLPEQLGVIWRMEIEPYLDAYFLSDPKQVDDFRWEKVKELLRV